LSSCEKFLNRANDIDKSREDERKTEEERPQHLDYNKSAKKFTSLANVNMNSTDEIPRHKEKFSQWRDNILRKQEEPTKEKQLQSLQVRQILTPRAIYSFFNSADLIDAIYRRLAFSLHLFNAR
jgi:hypothetical protein